ncbi:hypothetical protein [Gluconobacter kondonii]|uniref:hypothetical protein n=1 Tax=Gluconobacter kondonii TaxID=941463 RepID=UPI001B8D3271|nr:hypothetical protein [Gluconobacter kondonii]MBS1079080.1 hypothetical protein [Gluconobacter kondonii]MBS1082314.1 hypothetical protein [Gluconobacter kondonii]
MDGLDAGIARFAQMDMGVNDTRQYVQTGTIDDFGCLCPAEISDGDDPSVSTGDIGTFLR